MTEHHSPNKPDLADTATKCYASEILQALVDEESQAIILSLHRAAKTGTLLEKEMQQREEISVESQPISSESGPKINPKVAIFQLLYGPMIDFSIVSFQARSYQRDQHANQVIECANCGQRISVLRYAPHLDKCLLGKGLRPQSSASRNAGSSGARSSSIIDPPQAHPQKRAVGASAGRPRKNVKA